MYSEPTRDSLREHLGVSMKKPKYVIFDCDGVLVDSEILANRVEAEIKTALGFPTTTEEQIRKFVGFGTNHPDIKKEIKKLPSNYLEMVDEKLEKVYENELLAIDGINETLELLQTPKCVASSSELEWIEKKLSLVQLSHHFTESLFSGHMVQNGKPAPDLFLFAAEKMGWNPAECLVVEDSEAGVRAGKAAGMTVCGFMGGQHIYPGHAEKLLKLGADLVISDIRKLLLFME